MRTVRLCRRVQQLVAYRHRRGSANSSRPIVTGGPMLCRVHRPLVAVVSSIASLLLAATGCGGAEDPSSTSASTTSEGGPMASVTLQFEARVGDQAFDCTKTFPGIGTTATEVSLTDFRLYLHDIRL